MELVPREDARIFRADVFRRGDVDYTTVTWTDPYTGEDVFWSVPIFMLTALFKPSVHTPEDEAAQFERDRETYYEWNWR